MRARNLKPGFFKNEILGSADPLYGQLFQGLWLMADREGRLEDRPLRICAELFPYRRKVTEKKVDEMLAWLEARKFIVRYQLPIVTGQKTTRSDQIRYIEILEFTRHQNPHKNEAPSIIPSHNELKQKVSNRSHGASTVVVLEQNGTNTGVEPDENGTTRASSLIPHSLIPDSPLSDSRVRSNGGSGSGVRESKYPVQGPENAWRDITECDPQAYETWLGWRVDEHDVVPPRVRIQDAKFLAGKGDATAQRAFVDELIRLRFRRLHNPINGFGNGNDPARAGPEVDPPITWRPPADDEDTPHANG